MVRGDPLIADREARDGRQAIREAHERRAAPADGAHLSAGVEAVSSGEHRVQHGDEVDAPVGQLLVLEHQHRGAAGVRAGDHVQRVRDPQRVSSNRKG